MVTEKPFNEEFPSLSRFVGMKSEISGERYLPVEKIVQCTVDIERVRAEIESERVGNCICTGSMASEDPCNVCRMAIRLNSGLLYGK